MRIQYFAKEHNLVLAVRKPSEHFAYCAHFVGVEVKEGCMLHSKWGQGRTHALAVEDYCFQISRRTLVIGRDKGKEERVIAPELTNMKRLEEMK